MDFILCIVLGVLLLLNGASTCPIQCTCVTNLNIDHVVDCVGRGLTTIPTDIPSHATTIQLSSNLITTIKTDAFICCPDVGRIYMLDNKYSIIESGAFRNLPKLWLLSLWEGNVTTFDVIEERAFVNLPSLEYLDLNMYCDNCKLVAFYEWIKKETQLKRSPVCKDFANAKLSSLPESVFEKCDYDVR